MINRKRCKKWYIWVLADAVFRYWHTAWGYCPKKRHALPLIEMKKTCVKSIPHRLPLLKLSITGAYPEYAEQAKAQIRQSISMQKLRLDLLLQQTAQVTVIAGIGGVVGSWATLLLCNQWIEEGKQVDLVVVTPFAFEKGRAELAEHVLPLFSAKIRKHVFHNNHLTRSGNLAWRL